MTRACCRRLAALLLAGAAFAGAQSAAAGEAGGINPASRVAPTLSAADRAAIVDELVERLRADPEILVETLLRFRQAELADSTLGLAPSEAPSSGRPDAQATVVEFVDYGCVPCRSTGKVLDGLVDTGEIRVVHRDLPLSSEGIEQAASALEAHKAAGRYGEFRKALLKGEHPDASAYGAERPFALALMKRNRSDATRLGIKALPAVAVVRNGRMQLLSGEVGAEQVRAAVKSLSDR